MPVLTRKLLKHSETQSSNSKILIDIEIVPEKDKFHYKRN